ncbi:MAG TPA: energy transducer TonB [Acidobacteriaceae bacterium]|jgi:hypothetical protein
MRVIPFFLLLCLVPALTAQTSFSPLVVDDQAAQEHLREHPNLGIAPIAKLAHVVGEVAIQVKIDPSGRVVGATVLSGPPMLIGTATDSVREWTFAPFTKDGQPVFAAAVVKVFYTELTPVPKHGESSQLQNYYHAQLECAMSQRQGSKPAESAKLCGKFAESGDALPSRQFAWEQRKAYIDASKAYLHNNQLDEALAEAEKAVALVKSGNDDSQSIMYAYAARALVEVQKHDLSAADADFSIAEEAERGGVATVQSESIKKAYTKVLKSILETRAQVLNALGNLAEAKVKSDEAAKL